MQRRAVFGDYIWAIDGLLDRSECDRLIAWTEALGYSRAPLTTAKGPVMEPRVRNNRRVMVDDLPLSRLLFDRLAPAIGWRPGRGAQPVGLNERLRFYRYEVGERFAAHYDASFERPGAPGIRSLFSVLVYLNGGCEGGETHFFEQGHRIVPEAGLAVAFVHHQRHASLPVRAGRKYVLRSDLMYDLRPYG